MQAMRQNRKINYSHRVADNKNQIHLALQKHLQLLKTNLQVTRMMTMRRIVKRPSRSGGGGGDDGDDDGDRDETMNLVWVENVAS